VQTLDLDSHQNPDWRMRASLGLTAVWLLLGVIYISTVVGWTDFAFQKAPALGSFLEGAFAPLAFLWLVVGFFLQQQLLQENTRTIQAQLEQMRLTNEQVEVQTRAIAADELHSRQDTFLRVNELVGEQLGMISAWIVISHSESPGEFQEHWRRVGSGESNTFAMEIIRACLSGEVDAGELFYATEIRSGHTKRFVEAFERLLASGAKCDPDGLIVTALREGPHGRVHRLMTESAS
jgi:hypothetical protein